MNMPFDDRARAVHAQALHALSPRVQAQLAQRRHAALASGTSARASHARWGWIGAAATACVLVVALQVGPSLRAPTEAPRTIAAVQEAPADPGSLLAEDPDFYLWLASGESQAYAME